MYKVVLNKNGTLNSVTETMRLLYSIGKETFPHEDTRGLFIFKKLEDAKAYAGSNNDFEIYKCTPVNPRATSTVGVLNKMYMKRYWENDDQYFKEEAPKGTYICDSLILGEKV